MLTMCNFAMLRRPPSWWCWPARWTLTQDFPDATITRRLATGAAWAILGNALGQSLSLAATVAGARLLGTSAFGQLVILLATINLFSMFSSLGLGVTATKYVAEFRRSNPQRAGRIIGMSLLSAGACGVLVSVIVMFFAAEISGVLGARGLADNVRITAVTLLFNALNSAQVGVLAGFEAFDVLAATNGIRGITTLVAVVVGSLLGGLDGAVIAYAVVGVVNVAVHELAISMQCRRAGVSRSYTFDRQDIAILWRFSVPVLVASLSYTPAVWLSNVLFSRRSGFAAIGVFNAAFQWQAAVLFLPTAVASLGLPMLSNVLSERNAARYRHCLLLNFSLTSVPALAGAVVVATGAPLIMAIYGPSYANGVPALRWICVAAFLYALSISVGQAIWSLNAVLAGMALSLLRGGALVVAAWYLAPFGATGMSLAHLATAAVLTLVQAPFVLRLLRNRERAWSGASTVFTGIESGSTA